MDLGEHAHRRRHPAQQRFMDDPERQHVEARQRAVLPPRQRRGRIGEGSAEAPDVCLAQFAQEARLDQLDHDPVPLEAEGAGHDLSDKVGVLAGGGEHAVGLGGVHAQPCLGQDVLALGQRCECDRAVQVGPGADDDGINLGVGDQLLPVAIGARDAVLVGGGGGGFRPAVDDSDHLNVGQGAQPGDMPQPGVGPGTDQADAQRRVCHEDLAGEASEE